MRNLHYLIYQYYFCSFGKRKFQRNENNSIYTPRNLSLANTGNPNYRFMIPYLYLPEYMKIHGYEATDSAHIISVIGIAQTIGMIGLGYVGDRSWMNVNICYSACMVGECAMKIRYCKYREGALIFFLHF